MPEGTEFVLPMDVLRKINKLCTEIYVQLGYIVGVGSVTKINK